MTNGGPVKLATKQPRLQVVFFYDSHAGATACGSPLDALLHHVRVRGRLLAQVLISQEPAQAEQDPPSVAHGKDAARRQEREWITSYD